MPTWELQTEMLRYMSSLVLMPAFMTLAEVGGGKGHVFAPYSPA